MSFVLLQISDPHFGTQREEAVRAVVALANAIVPDLIVLSGDITQRATPAQFDSAHAFVHSLAAPALVIPGNHDIPLFAVLRRLINPYGRYCAAFGAELEPVFDSEQCLAVTVKTTRRYRHKDGEVSDAQIDRVAARLERAAPEQLRVVVVHQPLAVTCPEDNVNRLHGREAAAQRWSSAGADLVLGGHIHLPFVLPLHQEFVGCRRNLWAVQAGTAVSTRVRSGAPNSVNVIRYSSTPARRSCAVERWDCAVGKPVFEQVASHLLMLDAPQPRPDAI